MPAFAFLSCLLLLAGCRLFGAAGADVSEVPATVPYDDRSLSGEARATYREIAAQLTAGYLADHPDHPAADEVALPGDLWDRYYHFLLHLGESEAFAETGVPYPAFLPPHTLRHALVHVDTTQAWAQRLRDGVVPTGSGAFDALWQAYGLEPEPPRAARTWLTLRADTLYNVRALLPRLRAVPGVVHAEPNGLAGGGNRLAIAPRSGGWQVRYGIGSGDCPAGCIHYQTFTFFVEPDGAVRLLRTEGTRAGG